MQNLTSRVGRLQNRFSFGLSRFEDRAGHDTEILVLR